MKATQSLLGILTALVLVTIISLPLLAYVKAFGIGIWSDHVNWGIMGSAIGGIYTAIFAFLTLLVLVGQIYFQLRSHRYTIDMTYISDNKADYNEMFHKLNEMLIANNASAGVMLIDFIESIPEDKLLESESVNLISHFNDCYPQVIPLWSALQPILIGLSHNKHFPYVHNFLSLKLKTSSILSHRICVSLDKALYINRKGDVSYFFYWVKN